ncbi:MAG: hypothetical protein SPH93_02380 [Clostridium sp.]|uniref:hypothetical protein n=1 Tax=Clostridium sp. TaxID=1506 RepID=UPI0025C60276|nr:hypothetical protein [Clostridium sp.]MDY6226518.1 hypothetical protein [Clostridium sp.]
MTRKRKEFKLTEKNLEYIEEVKEKNNLKYSSEALELIIREHKVNSDITIEATVSLIAKEVAELIRPDIKGIKKSSNSSDRNSQVIIELLNGFCVINSYGRLATREDDFAPAVKKAEDFIDTKIEKEFRKNIYNKNSR